MSRRLSLALTEAAYDALARVRTPARLPSGHGRFPTGRLAVTRAGLAAIAKYEATHAAADGEPYPSAGIAHPGAHPGAPA